jgi:hypothetical protein
MLNDDDVPLFNAIMRKEKTDINVAGFLAT